MKIIDRRVDLIPEYDFNNRFRFEDVLLFDIETTGLSKAQSQLYLIGCAYLSDDGWHIRQWLTASASDELRALEDFLQFASGYKVLVHFNGDGFDIPYLAYKADYYFLDNPLAGMESFDIYKEAKHLKKLCGLDRMGQRSIEEFLGIDREDELNGGLLIPYYFRYETTGSAEDEKYLLLHNFDDIQGMFRILRILRFNQIPEGRYEFESFEECQGTAIFNYRLEEELPAEIEINNRLARISASGDLLQINITITEGVGRLPIADVENYFYLPEEDIVIHKDVAQFVDRQYRKKATKKNCFIKKEGRFLPQPSLVFEPGYVMDDAGRNKYFEITDDILADKSRLKIYADDIINCK
ncbi:MAG: ribonuclease H-like domain-containing protein [Lachnospiraceae bacterium]|nr:ribonuclease H-like domain-containing protein [Lachnospiraceae bacterium]MBR6350274.1 ribonuclease H-like domain-containing protein [Lachnospiraceae bacterium]